MYTSYSRTILSKIITSKRCGLLTACNMLAIIFWIIQKTYRLHVTCWNESGRKLPTAFNSQQLLRWLRPKRYIFSFFLHTKNTKKYVHMTPISSPCRHWIPYPKLVSGMSEILNFLGPQKSSSEVPKVVLSGHVRKSPENLESYEILKNHKNPENRRNREKVRKVEFLASQRLPYVTCWNRCPDTKSRLFATFRKSPDFWKSLSGHEISGSRRCQKKCKIFDFSGPQKNRNFGLYAVGTTRRKWRHISIGGGKKNALFSTFSRVKQKIVPFSAILSIFLISDFF